MIPLMIVNTHNFNTSSSHIHNKGNIEECTFTLLFNYTAAAMEVHITNNSSNEITEAFAHQQKAHIYKMNSTNFPPFSGIC